MTKFRSCYGHRTDDLTSDCRILRLIDWSSARCPGPVTQKNNPAHRPSTSADSWYQLFGFLQTWHCALWPNASTSVQRLNLNLICPAMFLLESGAFLLAALPNTTSLLFCTIMNFDSKKLTEAYRVWSCVFFTVSLITCISL